MSKLSWLHITDFHQGLNNQKWFWPTIREEFYRDLEYMYKQTGPWNLVLFTGDLTQKATEDEFKKLDETLSKIWDKFKELGCAPLLVAVPGNHDLSRPEETSFEVSAFSNWNRDEGMRKRFWEDEKGEGKERTLITKIFANYDQWLGKTLLPLASKATGCEYKKGLLPGDFSLRLPINNLQVGIVGLNTAFLQLGDFVKEGDLDIDIRQVAVACDEDTPAWLKQNDINILMTHHPVNWFSERARSHFASEILGSKNFFTHIYGHMHEGKTEFTSFSGSEIIRKIQGTSLFGLLDWGNGSENRIHGYNVVQVSLAESEDKGELRFWPRIVKRPNNLSYKIRPDDERFELNYENNFIHEFSLVKKKRILTEKQ